MPLWRGPVFVAPNEGGVVATMLSVHSFRGGTGKSNTTGGLVAVFAERRLHLGAIDTDIQSPGMYALFRHQWHDISVGEVATDISARVGLRNRRRQFLIAPALALVVALAACSGSPAGSEAPRADAATDKLAQVQARGTLVGIFAPDYAPQSLLIEGALRPADTKCLGNQLSGAEVTGYDNETTKLVARDLGVEACFASPQWGEITAGHWNDRWDIAYGSGSINADRMQRLYMTQPYYATPNHFFVRADSSYQTADELSGLKVGVCASCSHEYYLKHELEIPGVTLTWDIEDPEIVAYETEGPGLQALADGDIDAFLCAEPVGQALIAQGLDLRQLEKPAFTFFPSGFVDRSSGLSVKAFIDRVNKIIRAAHADGRMVALAEEWFGADYATAAGKFDLDVLSQDVD